LSLSNAFFHPRENLSRIFSSHEFHFISSLNPHFRSNLLALQLKIVSQCLEVAMDRCSDSRPLSELDPVTFFIITELMAGKREQVQTPKEILGTNEDILAQVA
jgi:hypothetical protein